MPVARPISISNTIHMAGPADDHSDVAEQEAVFQV